MSCGDQQRLIAQNRAGSVIATGISDSDTSITVRADDGAMFAAPDAAHYSILAITDAQTGRACEFVKATNRTGDVFTVVRGQLGTTAVAWESGSLIRDTITTGLIDVVSSELDCINNQISAMSGRLLRTIRIGTASTYTPSVDCKFYKYQITHS